MPCPQSQQPQAESTTPQHSYALVGRRLGHSWSAQWHNKRFAERGMAGYSYTLHEVESLANLRRWAYNNGIEGFNVTVPYKQEVLPLLDAIDSDAEQIGAVNCVKVWPDGRITGHNTDWQAFAISLRTLALPPTTTAIVLGTGGAARAVGYALHAEGFMHTIYVSRNAQQCTGLQAVGYEAARAVARAAQRVLLVNATPVGMFPNTAASPWPWPADFNTRWQVYDLTYNPSPTLLMQQATARGAQATDGLTMLELQAQLSCKVWGI